MVKELAGRLAALDPDAGAAVRVIAYFDRLNDGHAGLETIVRGAAVLSGCPARLADVDRALPCSSPGSYSPFSGAASCPELIADVTMM